MRNIDTIEHIMTRAPMNYVAERVGLKSTEAEVNFKRDWIKFEANRAQHEFMTWEQSLAAYLVVVRFALPVSVAAFA